MNKKSDIKHDSNSLLTLTEAPLCVPLRVSAIRKGCGAQARLASLGILPGEELMVLRRNNGGPILLEVKGTRVALGQGICSSVQVQNLNGSEN